jgi:hypothetical protein
MVWSTSLEPTGASLSEMPTKDKINLQGVQGGHILLMSQRLVLHQRVCSVSANKVENVTQRRESMKLKLMPLFPEKIRGAGVVDELSVSESRLGESDGTILGIEGRGARIFTDTPPTLAGSARRSDSA